MNTIRYFIITGFIFFSVIVWCVGINVFAKDAKPGGYIIGYPETVEDVQEQFQPEETERHAVTYTIRENSVPEAPLETQQAIDQETLKNKDLVIRALQEKLVSRDRQIVILSERVDRLNKIIEEKETALFMMKPAEMNHYKVRKGDNLWKIASRKDVYGDPYMWITIYNANMDKIKDKNLIFPGQLFDIPK